MKEALIYIGFAYAGTVLVVTLAVGVILLSPVLIARRFMNPQIQGHG